MEMESMIDSSEQVERIAATVEEVRRDEELRVRLAELERELAELKASGIAAAAAARPLEGLRRTLPTATTELLAKRGIGEGPVSVASLDSALNGLSLEQRIAVKSQLHRMGAIV